MPKEIRWYDGGHRLSDGATSEVAAWLATQLGERADQSRLA
jgi:hypothetical protein